MRALLTLIFAASLLACASQGGVQDAGDAGDLGPSTPSDAGPDAGSSDDAGPVIDAGVNPACAALQLPTAAFIPGSSGTHRGDIAPDFSLPLYDGGIWQLSQELTGCDSYVFVTDLVTVSSIDATPLATTTDWAGLITASPPNAHYFFLSVDPNAAKAAQIDQAVAQKIASALASQTSSVAAEWQSRLHVVAGNAQSLTGPLGPVATGWGLLGFAIDRQQKYRGIGDLGDVTRFNQATQNDAGWGWLGNLAYAANEVVYMNAQAITQARLDAEGATVLTLFDGGVLSQYADIDATLPSPSELSTFDTLEVEVTQRCPNPDDLELNSCGAWDYLAFLQVDDPSVPYDADAGYSYLELARFITSYHRETHWVVDATPMLARLAAGGTRHFRWSFAPPWNVQPTATVVNLRFSSQSKGYRPEALLPLWTDTGATFDQTYDGDHPPVTVSIPSDATRTELWMIVTGHGSDANSCCEFCNHEHQFTVNGTNFLVQFPEAGTENQCIPEQANGMTPNQAGTWWFGRGGWCPGEQVDPHVFDVTSLVTPGQNATVTTLGMLASKPPPTGGGGDVVLQSMLVVYH